MEPCADAAPASAVAAFDFDGTLASGDSLLPFVRRVAGVPTSGLALGRHGPRVALATAARIGSRDRAKAAFVTAALRGLEEARLDRQGRAFADHLHERLPPPAVARLRGHQSQGHRCVIVSASLLVSLEPLRRPPGRPRDAGRGAPRLRHPARAVPRRRSATGAR